MTVPNQIFRNDADADGTTATYGYNFKIFLASQLQVVISDNVLLIPDVTLVLGVDYNVTGAGLSGGSVVLVNGTGLLVGGVLPINKHIAIIRNVTLTQGRDLRNQGKYFPEYIEDALDYVTFIAQQQQDQINRALKVANSQATDANTLVFPSVASRANQLLGFNAQGDPIAVSAGGAVSGSWQALIDASNFVGARTLLGFAGSGGTVQTANIDPLGLAAAALANLAVTTAKINDLAVTTAKLADASVTTAKLATGIQADPGDLWSSMRASKTGWLLCDGAAVSRSTYADLFSAIGTQHGSGDGSTTFNVPNLKGRFLRGLQDYGNAVGSGSAATNNATFTAHLYKQTGIKVRLQSGALSGLTTSTDYYIIYIDANTLAFATSRTNAIAGTKIAISGANSAVLICWEDPDSANRVSATVGASGSNNLGSIEDDSFKNHSHTIGKIHANIFGSSPGSLTEINTPDTSSGPTGDNETRPMNIACNYFIKY